MREFLNPRSMITPGVAGATMMFLVNGLTLPFPELPARYVALSLSLLIGAAVVSAARMQRAERAVYWILNSLVIFVVGFGANGLGREATAPGQSTPPAVSWLAPLVETAAAEEPPGAAAGGSGPPAAAPAEKADAAEAKRLRERVAKLEAENSALRAGGAQPVAEPQPPRPAPERKGFFKKW